jgi:hypothetical protein
VRHSRRHDPIYLIGFATLMVVSGFSLMAYEKSVLSSMADQWHHFWFCLGVVGAAGGFLFGVATLLVYEVQRRRIPSEQSPTVITSGQGRLRREIETVREYEPGPESKGPDANVT